MAKVSRIAPEVPVDDVRESIEYYEQKLGFRNVMELPGGDYAIVERDSVAIHLFRDGITAHPPIGMHIFTDQIEDLYSELLARGAQIIQEITLQPWGNRDFRVRDSSGNQIKFTEPALDEG